MQSLFSILNNKSFSSPLIKGVNASLTVEATNEVLADFFTEKIKEFASAAYVKNHVLHIACLSSVTAQEIKLREGEIIEAINKKMKFNAVKKIKYLS